MHESLSAAVRGLSGDLTGRMAGEYRLGRKLGEGGCGAVYEAEHPVLKRRAAVKVLHRAPLVGSTGFARFVAEAQAVHRIRSRHLVDVFSLGELEDGRPFFVMDLLEGEPLDRYVARCRRLPLAAALQILEALAQALDLAHRAGVVHRDLKPQNVFLACEPDGEIVPKVLDFGIAKLLHDEHALTVSGAVLGTPLYMSPEQARGEHVDGRSDVYALGVLAYQLLTGRLPIRAETMIGVALAHATQMPTPPSEHDPALPALLDAPLLRMLAKRPEDRPATAGEALSALRAAAEQSGWTIPRTLRDVPRPEPRPVVTPTLPTTCEDTQLAHAPHVQAAPIQGVERAQSGERLRRRPAPLARALGVAALGSALIASALLGWAPRGRPVPGPAPRPLQLEHEQPSRPTRVLLPAARPEPASLTASSHAPVASQPGVERARKRKMQTAKRRRELTPRDLENPF